MEWHISEKHDEIKHMTNKHDRANMSKCPHANKTGTIEVWLMFGVLTNTQGQRAGKVLSVSFRRVKVCYCFRLELKSFKKAANRKKERK